MVDYDMLQGQLGMCAQWDFILVIIEVVTLEIWNTQLFIIWVQGLWGRQVWRMFFDVSFEEGVGIFSESFLCIFRVS